MKKATAKAMVKRINEREGEGTAVIYKNYSGRYMFEKTTTGVVAPGWAMPKNHKYKEDSLGLQQIIY